MKKSSFREQKMLKFRSMSCLNSVLADFSLSSGEIYRKNQRSFDCKYFYLYYVTDWETCQKDPFVNQPKKKLKLNEIIY